jgi:hypothetical protein
MSSVICIKAWNRLGMLEKTLTKLSKCINIEKYNIIISIDGPNNKSKVKKFNDGILKNNITKVNKKIQLFYQDKNIGCAGNMRFCFVESFKENDYMIHLEDDSVPGKDFLLFMEWGYKYSKDNDNIFAICPFLRKKRFKKLHRDVSLEKDLYEVTLLNMFDPAGGFGINKKQWEYISEDKGVFGVIGQCGNNLKGNKWLKNLLNSGGRITDKGSWAWPFMKYYIKDKDVLFPKINRCQNIGNKDGLFNPNAKWHKETIFNNVWVGNDFYKGHKLNENNFYIK